MPDRGRPAGLVGYGLIRLPAALRALAAAALLCLPATAALAGRIADARLWNNPEYTRITLDSDTPLGYRLASLTTTRLSLELEGATEPGALESLARQLPADAPHLREVRVDRTPDGSIRLVLELRTEVQPQAYRLPRDPAITGARHRLVLDVHPVAAPDALMALLGRQSPAAGPGSGPRASHAPTPAPVAEPRRTAAAALADPAQAEQCVERLAIVAIDAGHGGVDPGARGANGAREKAVTLAIARRLKAAIDTLPGLRAVLVRESDVFIPLQQRVARARKAQADLFVSIHADAFIRPDARGSSVFALSERGATSAAARWLARRENEADLIGGVNIDVPDADVKKVLLDLSQAATIRDSLAVGRRVLAELGQINELHKPHVEQAGFAVLKAPDIPSILVETAFISNPDEEQRLLDEAYQEQLARAIAEGVRRHFLRNPPVVRASTQPAALAAGGGERDAHVRPDGDPLEALMAAHSRPTRSVTRQAHPAAREASPARRVQAAEPPDRGRTAGGRMASGTRVSLSHARHGRSETAAVKVPPGRYQDHPRRVHAGTRESSRIACERGPRSAACRAHLASRGAAGRTRRVPL